MEFRRARRTLGFLLLWGRLWGQVPMDGLNPQHRAWAQAIVRNPDFSFETRTPPAKVRLEVRAGDTLRIKSPGGGGWGPTATCTTKDHQFVFARIDQTTSSKTVPFNPIMQPPDLEDAVSARAR